MEIKSLVITSILLTAIMAGTGIFWADMATSYDRTYTDLNNTAMGNLAEQYNIVSEQYETFNTTSEDVPSENTNWIFTLGQGLSNSVSTALKIFFIIPNTLINTISMIFNMIGFPAWFSSTISMLILVLVVIAIIGLIARGRV